MNDQLSPEEEAKILADFTAYLARETAYIQSLRRKPVRWFRSHGYAGAPDFLARHPRIIRMDARDEYEPTPSSPAAPVDSLGPIEGRGGEKLPAGPHPSTPSTEDLICWRQDCRAVHHDEGEDYCPEHRAVPGRLREMWREKRQEVSR